MPTPEKPTLQVQSATAPAEGGETELAGQLMHVMLLLAATAVEYLPALQAVHALGPGRGCVGEGKGRRGRTKGQRMLKGQAMGQRGQIREWMGMGGVGVAPGRVGDGGLGNRWGTDGEHTLYLPGIQPEQVAEANPVYPALQVHSATDCARSAELELEGHRAHVLGIEL